MTRVPRLTLTYHRGVRHDVRRALDSLLPALVSLSPLRHRMSITVVRQATIRTPDAVAFAAFYYPSFERKRVRIYLGAGVAEMMQKEVGDTRAEAIAAVLTNFLHEWAHYEQYRDGKPIQERGVNVRAKSLAKKLGVVA